MMDSASLAQPGVEGAVLQAMKRKTVYMSSVARQGEAGVCSPHVVPVKVWRRKLVCNESPSPTSVFESSSLLLEPPPRHLYTNLLRDRALN